MPDLLQACLRRARHVLVREDAVGADRSHHRHEMLWTVETLDGHDGSLRDPARNQRLRERQTLQEEV